MANKKILFFIKNIPPDYGGGWKRIYNQALRISSFTEVEILTKTRTISSNETSIFSFQNDIELIFGICKSLLKNRGSGSQLYITSIEWYTLIFILLSKFLKISTVLGITLSKVDSPANKGKSKLGKIYYFFKNLQFHLVNKINFNSPVIYKECLDYGIPPKKLFLIPNSVNLETFKPFSKKKIDDYKRKILKNNRKTILMVGVVNKRKGYDIIPELLNRLISKDFKNFNLVICGHLDGKKSNFLIKKITESCKTNGLKFYFFENVNNMSIFYNISDILLFPSRNEGLPNVILEALACNTKIICNELKGITDYIFEKKNIQVQNINNLNRFSLKLIKILKTPNLTGNRKIIENRFNQLLIDKYFFEMINK